MNNNQIRRRHKTFAKTVGIGMRLGLLVFTAYLIVRLCKIGLEILESRTGTSGGEVFILPLIILLIWIGWIARKEYTDLTKRTEDKHDFRRYITAAREEASSFLGMTITEQQWEDSMPRALQKLNRIINRYGDENGERLKPYYLGKLIEEDIREKAFSDYTMIRCREMQTNKKEKSRHLSATTKINPPKLYTASGSKVNAATE